MKRIKLLILGLGLMAAPITEAVTLPTTSYSSYSSEPVSSTVYSVTSGPTITGGYLALGTSQQECEDACDATAATCMAGCLSESCIEECAATSQTCKDACSSDVDPLGPTSPLDESVLLISLLCVMTLAAGFMRYRFTNK